MSVLAQTAPESPALVLLLVVDQLRPERIHAGLPGGLGRLVREGRVFTDAVFLHGLTETCPGHATIVTGRHPGAAGIPANEFIDLSASKVRYCVGDAAASARVLGSEGEGKGRSPRSLRVTSIGGWLKAAQPRARVYAVSGKDRAAVVLGGKRADAAFWFERGGKFRFTTSRYYLGALPRWVERWSGRELLNRVPDRWVHPTGAPANGARRDDYPYEAPLFGRTSGHPVHESPAAAPVPALYFTPFLDELTLAFARALVENEDLGRRGATDLLAISLSATDSVGHLYGPFSQEAHDALLRLDASLERFLSFLEERLPGGRLLVVLTADHGVLPVPEWLAETGRSACPVPGGRIDARQLRDELEAALREQLDPPGTPPAPWLVHAGSLVAVNRTLAAQRGVAVTRVAHLARKLLAERPGVAHVWSAQELSRGDGPRPYAELFQHSFDPERSGDLLVQPAASCLVSSFSTGTSHGSPYLYDRAVPLVFFGSGVSPGTVRAPAALVDVAPTLAAQLGLIPPAGLAGKPLALHGQ
jgi:predicted AlkP superfamily pyrophosphatase or phosphodiesterase